MPTYQRLAYLRETVASVLAQTYPRWELVVVDDGSTDGSAAWLRGLGDPRIRVLEIPHSGNLGLVRNRAMAAARGALLAFLDSDDLFEPRKLEVQLAALQARPECGWSYTAMTRIDAEGREIVDPPVRWREISGWILEDLLRFDAIVDTPSVMARRELLRRVGPLDEALPECQDYDLYFRMAAASPAVMVPEPLTRKRVHGAGLSRHRSKINEAWVTVYQRFGAGSADPGVRRICARQARRHRLAAAHCRAADGQPRRALRHVASVLARRPWSPEAWGALLRGVIGRGVVRPAARRWLPWMGRSRAGASARVG